ncbi:DUF2259 domain-containing protein [Phyllobacterium lublinensis]|jgi:predicted secreted protein|uniref:DUF2259 domain-containing protein n=1 Tax=Phyllobacterium lublinensis TaxID=2875708 RepID=UPI001CCA4530|nr:DUF2259 domain-containing protein [Phyllobacterium sp. 2063]MBZ9653415.1 DUF2259 domain-containing protein [Phyllobacterium sp. 2063]
MYRRLRQAMIVALFMGAWPLVAQAGDAAKLDILGFSKDGGVFAFEEYGVQDGSGFPYANRFYIDTANDTFLPKTPVRVRLDDEAAPLESARGKAGLDAQGVTSLTDQELRANAGQTVAVNPVTELSADPFKVRINPRPVFPAIDPALTIQLEEVDVPASETCQNVGEIKGFRLTLLEETPAAKPELLHADTTVPASRGCPQGYSIGAVQTYYPEGGKPVIAVMIAVRAMGFEGPNHRWLAVTKRR